MIAQNDDVILVCTGDKEPNRFEYWEWYKFSKPVAGFLKTLNRYGGFGKAYYYSENKIWFKKEKYLTMYLLIKE